MAHNSRQFHRRGRLAAVGLFVALGVLLLRGWLIVEAQPQPTAVSHQDKSLDWRVLAGMTLHTFHNTLRATDGHEVLLRGVNVTCMENTTPWPQLRHLLDLAIRQWHCNFIRLPLNEDRWLGRATNEKDHGLAYRQDIQRAVRMCARHRVYISLDLRWTDRGIWGSKAWQADMPDPHALIFWRDLATKYKKFPNVLFGLFSEPHGVDWLVWHNGGTCMESRGEHLLIYRAIGMQALSAAIRATGSHNVILISGIDWASNLFGVLHGFAVKRSNVAYDIHLMGNNAKDWNRRFLLVAQQYPLIVGEWGGYGMPQTLRKRLVKVMDAHHLSWAAWRLGNNSLIKKQKSSWILTDFGRLVVKAIGHDQRATSGGLKHE